MAARGHILDASTLALWRCDEASGALVDASGNGRNLAPQATTPVSVGGVIGGARRFDGVQDAFTRTTPDAALDAAIAGAFTIEAWINLGGTYKQECVWAVTGGGSQWCLYLSSAGVPYFGSSFTAGAQTVIGTRPAPGAGWRHIAGRVTVTGSTRTLDVFLDGVKLNTLTGLTPPSFTVGSLRIGNISLGSHQFNGSVDDVRLSNGARTDAEIAESHARGAPFLSLGGIELPVRDGTANREEVVIGENPRAFDGTLRGHRQGIKQRFAFETPWLEASEAEAWLNFIRGVGWSWDFEGAHLYSHNGRGPTAHTGSSPSTSSVRAKFGTRSMGVAASSSVTFGLPIGSAYTVQLWRWSGVAWAQYIFRSDGAKWLDGARNDSIPLAAVAATSSTGIVFSSNTNFDDLVVLPYLVPSTWPLAWAGAASPFSPLPNLVATGDFIGGTATVRGAVTEVKYQAGVTASGFNTNLQSLVVQLDEV